jgi:integrase
MTDGGETIMYAARPLAHYFAADTMLSLTPNRVRDYWVWRRAHSVARTGDDDFEVVEQPISDGTIIRELAGVLRPAIKHAINERRLIAGVYDVPVPTQPPSRDYWITRSEAARLLREMKRDRRARLHLPLYTLIAVFTGARRGAILGLLWTQVDLINGQIDFNPPGRAQTSKRRSKIPVPRLLLAALRRAHARASSNNVIAYQGNPVLDIKTGFNSAAERAGLPQCSSHTLRHTAGTWISQRGVPLWEIAGYLGHSETRTTELYAHHSPEHLATAKRAMEGKHERHPLLGSQARTRES